MKVLVFVCLAFSTFFIEIVESNVGTCPEGWTKGIHGHTDSCYMIVTDESYSSYEAADSCIYEGAHLVSIEDQEENDWLIRELIPEGEKIWTGGYYLLDEEDTSGWYWERQYDEGVRIGYEHWGEKQPNMEEKGEACVVIDSDGDWDDVPCFQPVKGFICELD